MVNASTPDSPRRVNIVCRSEYRTNSLTFESFSACLCCLFRLSSRHVFVGEIHRVRQRWIVDAGDVNSGRVAFERSVQVIVLPGAMINSEPCADDGFIVKSARSPGDAYPRIKVPLARKVCGSAFRADIRYGGVRARQDPPVQVGSKIVMRS
jgi:hypothetical protein